MPLSPQELAGFERHQVLPVPFNLVHSLEYRTRREQGLHKEHSNSPVAIHIGMDGYAGRQKNRFWDVSSTCHRHVVDIMPRHELDTRGGR
jgi:hypothetical protein